MTVFEVLFLALFVFLLIVLARLTDAVERLNEVSSPEGNKAYDVAVLDGYTEVEPLPVGVYHPNEDDAAQYLFDKMTEFRQEKQRAILDWSLNDEGET